MNLNPDNNQPAAPVLDLGIPPKHIPVTGLLSVYGWGFTNDLQDPPGIVEISVNGCAWRVIEDRLHVEGLPETSLWAARCGYRAAVNTFFFPNGPLEVRVRLRKSTGPEILCRSYQVTVDNVGLLAERTRQSLRAFPGSKDIWTTPVDSSGFPLEASRGEAWFDRPDAEQKIGSVLARHDLPAELEPHLRQFIREGYIVLESLISRDWCDSINADLEQLLANGTFSYEWRGQRVEHLYQHSQAARDLWMHPAILKILSALYDDVALPCQTLNFIHGSQQGLHQDTIHLTPFPAGMMCGVWVALEDISPDAGPLVVYPKSHRLPTLYCATLGMQKVRNGDWTEFGEKFVPKIVQQVTDAGMQPMYYTPKAGTVLIWHENLTHGGSTRKIDEMTRRSIVSHYFARGGLAFYDSLGLTASVHAADIPAAEILARHPSNNELVHKIMRPSPLRRSA